MRKNRLVQRRGREKRGEEGREGGKKGIVRQPCLFSESGGTNLALSLVLRVHLEREGGHPKPWLLSRPVPGLDLLSALSLPCSP